MDPGRRNPGGAAQKCAVDGGRGDCGGHCVGGDARSSNRLWWDIFLGKCLGDFFKTGWTMMIIGLLLGTGEDG